MAFAYANSLNDCHLFVTYSNLSSYNIVTIAFTYLLNITSISNKKSIVVKHVGMILLYVDNCSITRLLIIVTLIL